MRCAVCLCTPDEIDTINAAEFVINGNSVCDNHVLNILESSGLIAACIKAARQRKGLI